MIYKKHIANKCSLTSEQETQPNLGVSYLKCFLTENVKALGNICRHSNLSFDAFKKLTNHVTNSYYEAVSKILNFLRKTSIAPELIGV